MEQGQIIYSDCGSPLFAIDKPVESKMRNSKNHCRGNFFSPYNTSPRGGNNSSSPGNSSGQESPDFIPFGFSSPDKGSSRGRGNHQWQRNNHSQKRYFGHGGYKGNMSPFNTGRGCYSSPYRGKRGGKTNPGHAADISLYYHHSMVEDPWAELLEEKVNVSCASGISLRVSEGDKRIVPVGRSKYESGSIASSSDNSFSLGSQGEESVESGSD